MIDLYVDGISLRKIETKHNERILIFQNEKDETVALNVSDAELVNIFRQIKLRCETLNLIPMNNPTANSGAQMNGENC